MNRVTCHHHVTNPFTCFVSLISPPFGKGGLGGIFKRYGAPSGGEIPPTPPLTKGGIHGCSKVPVLAFLLLFPLIALAQLPAPVVDELNRQRLDPSGLSIWIHPLDSDAPLLAHNADTPRNPASTIKLLTTYAGLELLGPQYSWRTEAYPVGNLRDGVLNGDLVLKGHGDPFLTPEAFWTLLRGLRDRGLRDIAGDLVLDRSFLAPPVIDPGAFDGEPHRAYNALPDALLINFQAIGFTLRPETDGVRIVANPAPVNLHIDNRLRLVSGGCRLDQLNLTIDGTGIGFAGPYANACGETVLHRVVLPPQQLLYGVFRDLWQDLGGTLRGGLREDQAPVGATPLYVRQSPTLGELIRGMNKYSNNVMTRMLLLSLGAEFDGPPGTEAKGSAIIERWLNQQGLAMPELVLDNGAGLSRATRISARSLGQLLRRAAASRFAPELQASLPLLGIDGTVSRRFRDHPLTGRARLKTGTLNDVRAVAGYLRGANGRDYVLVVLHNAPGVDQGGGTAVQDALLAWLYDV